MSRCCCGGQTFLAVTDTKAPHMPPLVVGGGQQVVTRDLKQGQARDYLSRATEGSRSVFECRRAGGIGGGLPLAASNGQGMTGFSMYFDPVDMYCGWHCKFLAVYLSLFLPVSLLGMMGKVGTSIAR